MQGGWSKRQTYLREGLTANINFRFNAFFSLWLLACKATIWQREYQNSFNRNNWMSTKCIRSAGYHACPWLVGPSQGQILPSHSSKTGRGGKAQRGLTPSKTGLCLSKPIQIWGGKEGRRNRGKKQKRLMESGLTRYLEGHLPMLLVVCPRRRAFFPYSLCISNNLSPLNMEHIWEEFI